MRALAAAQKARFLTLVLEKYICCDSHFGVGVMVMQSQVFHAVVHKCDQASS